MHWFLRMGPMQEWPHHPHQKSPIFGAIEVDLKTIDPGLAFEHWPAELQLYNRASLVPALVSDSTVDLHGFPTYKGQALPEQN